MKRSRSHLASGVLGLSLAASITLLGCSTVLHGGRQDVTFDSKPLGKKGPIAGELAVYITGMARGITAWNRFTLRQRL